ncbi:hypothetical protein PTSG_04420 [Salpingoeca rosetta]|uniref:Uncharacterized protein n=1 Tax=Salpingoeca rosetta (strain ATCC 50818 / BSB-021) TaxID=946362 RepID=F2U8I3_SALR5|nr:uncharacterized protein PTSG_04420 [Salpingoeca rosetta]EGD72691.1 hypothetical protein PTSG_04420 [Salpingoeca rosetta]|eukprot:XP_004994514.1 hypothetical protein PTSG_04420 [Salpingoeca rosetta]
MVLDDVSEALKLQAFGASHGALLTTVTYGGIAAVLAFLAHQTPLELPDPLLQTAARIVAYAVAFVLGLTAFLRTVVHVRAMLVVPPTVKALSPKQKKLTLELISARPSTRTTSQSTPIPKRFSWRHGPDESVSARRRRPSGIGGLNTSAASTTAAGNLSTTLATTTGFGSAPATPSAALSTSVSPSSHYYTPARGYPAPTTTGAADMYARTPARAVYGDAGSANASMMSDSRMAYPASGGGGGGGLGTSFAGNQSWGGRSPGQSFLSSSSLDASIRSDSFWAATPHRRPKFQPAVKSPERKPQESVDERVVPAPVVFRRICPSREKWQQSLFLCKQWVDSILKGIWFDIERVNALLQKSPDRHRIGVDSLATIQAAAHGDAYSPLQGVLPVLQLDPANQRYLVARIRDLATRRGYHTTGGHAVVDLEGKTIAYSDALPSDASIVFHCVCCFLDHESTLYHRNPGDIVHPDLRTFSNLHVVKYPERVADLEKRAVKTSVYMYFSQLSPPVFKLITRKDGKASVWELGTGHDSLFECIVAFVWYVVKMEGGVVDDHAQMRFAPGGLRVYEIVEPLINL